MIENRMTMKRFGTVAVEHRFVTPEQITAAMEIQIQENINTGQHRKIGVILYDEGMITAAQIQTVLSELNSAAKLAT